VQSSLDVSDPPTMTPARTTSTGSGKVLFEIRLKSEIFYQMISVIIITFLKCLPGKVLFEIRLKSEILYQIINHDACVMQAHNIYTYYENT